MTPPLGGGRLDSGEELLLGNDFVDFDEELDLYKKTDLKIVC